MGTTQPADTVPDTMRIIIIMVMAGITGSIIITVLIITNGLTQEDITDIGIMSHTADTTKDHIITGIIIINGIIISAIIISVIVIRGKAINMIEKNGIIISGTIASAILIDAITAEAIAKA
jgi:hypothetical protein